MNKQGWVIKKLGDICEIISGSTPKTNITDYWNGDYNWVTPAELNNDDDIIYKTNRKITSKAIKETNLKLLPIGTILLSSRAPIGKVAITGVEMYSNQGFKNLICSDVIFNRYLFRFLKGKTQYLNNLGRGATFKEISKEIVQNISIPVPPLPIQNQIVKELNTLQAIITKKKTQLDELDKLAQAIFYDMFGDPVENEKGWDIELLGSISNIGTGATPNRKKENIYFKGSIPWVKTTEVCGLEIHKTQESITELALQDTNCKIFPINTILLAMYGQGKTRGQVGLLKINATTNQACAAIVVKENVNYKFLYLYLKLNYQLIRSLSRGGNQENLNLSLVRSIPIMLPPLPLQNQFAEQIEAIEKQKALINQSIAETQLLFDSAMDNYFN